MGVSHGFFVTHFSFCHSFLVFHEWGHFAFYFCSNRGLWHGVGSGGEFWEGKGVEPGLATVHQLFVIFKTILFLHLFLV